MKPPDDSRHADDCEEEDDQGDETGDARIVETPKGAAVSPVLGKVRFNPDRDRCEIVAGGCVTDLDREEALTSSSLICLDSGNRGKQVFEDGAKVRAGADQHVRQ